jgi:hypothetical protein
MSLAGFDIGYVGPNQNSSTALSAGSYTLSARSNVPFVSLVGRGGFKKIFTWGETVKVPHKEMCTVRNESFHGGDIYINAGCEETNRPARITVPVPFTNVGGAWEPLFPADVRLARRAFLYFDAYVSANPPFSSTITILGLRTDGSHKTSNEISLITSPFKPGSGYVDARVIPVFTLLEPQPLGHLAGPPGDTTPHALLTTAAAYLTVSHLTLAPTGDNLPNAYYSMEY